jgi:hypothetical protein
MSAWQLAIDFAQSVPFGFDLHDSVAFLKKSGLLGLCSPQWRELFVQRRTRAGSASETPATFALEAVRQDWSRQIIPVCGSTNCTTGGVVEVQLGSVVADGALGAAAGSEVVVLVAVGSGAVVVGAGVVLVVGHGGAVVPVSVVVVPVSLGVVVVSEGAGVVVVPVSVGVVVVSEGGGVVVVPVSVGVVVVSVVVVSVVDAVGSAVGVVPVSWAAAETANTAKAASASASSVANAVRARRLRAPERSKPELAPTIESRKGSG